MEFELSRLLESSYYFESNPGGDFIVGYALLLFFIGLFFLKSFFQDKAKGDKYFKKSIKNQFWKFNILGAIGVVLVLARFAAVPGFAMRLWLYIIFIGAIIALIWTFFRVWKNYKKRLGSVERERGK